MKKLALTAAVLLSFQQLALAHGGQYTGPGDTVPRGGGGSGGGGGVGPAGPGGPSGPTTGGPTTPAGSSPGLPGGPSGTGTVTPGSTDGGMDLTLWNFWWELNDDPYLNLKSHVRGGAPGTGSDGWFLGYGERDLGRDSCAPAESQIRQQVVPALLAALERETSNDIVTGCLIALAKIGDPPSENGESVFEPVIARFLSDANQEISETAAVALGILANPRSIPTLESLLRDTLEGRRLVGQHEVGYRTRAFAAYGLGLIGARAESEPDRMQIVSILRRTLESENTSTRDLKVSCVIAMGLVPLETIESSAGREREGLMPPESSRLAQLDYLLSFLADEEQEYLVRAHCPTALARLLQGLPAEERATYRARIAEDLLRRVDRKANQQAEIVQSSVLALGLIGTNDGTDPLDRRIRAALMAAPKEMNDAQARNFALIALAKAGGTTSADARDPEGSVGEVAESLLGQLAGGKSGVRSWAGLACGVMARKLADAGRGAETVGSLQRAVRASLQEERESDRIGAFAIAAGIMQDREASGKLLELLLREKNDVARGYVAIGLGLMDAREAVQEIGRIVEDSKYRPDLLRQSSIALGLLGDKEVVPKLVELLQQSKGLATQASVSSALGFIGDYRSIDPLVAMLENGDLVERARAFAAVALGLVADKEALPWNSKIGVDLNYRASTDTLTDRVGNTGILDIL